MSGQYDPRTLAALHEALEDEYRARATYAAVIERFGPVRPFVNIVAAEDRHAAALRRLLEQGGHPVPADRWAGNVTAPASLRDALALGVRAEIDNRALYDRLRAMTARPEVLRVFDNLGTASQQNHLPAFQRHLDRLDGGGGNAGTPADGMAGWPQGGEGCQGGGHQGGGHQGGGGRPSGAGGRGADRVGGGRRGPWGGDSGRGGAGRGGR